MHVAAPIDDGTVHAAPLRAVADKREVASAQLDSNFIP